MSEGAGLMFWWRGLGVVALCGVSLLGCLGRSPEVEHFILGTAPSGSSQRIVDTLPVVDPSAAVGTSDPSDPSEVAVLVGPVILPAYLRRPQLARLEADGEIELDEFGRWLGGFEENFLRGISLGLAADLGSVKVVSYPSNAPFALDYRVRLHVDDLVLVESENALRIRIRWALIREGGEAQPKLFLLEKTLPVAGPSRESLVRVHEEALRELTAAISREIRRP